MSSLAIASCGKERLCYMILSKMVCDSGLINYCVYCHIYSFSKIKNDSEARFDTVDGVVLLYPV